jgi:hypothetical protein
MDLEEGQAHGLVPSLWHVSLSVVEKKAKGTAGSFPHNSQSGLTKILGVRHSGGEQAPVQMRLQARLPSAKHAFLPRFSSAQRATHSQYLSGREFFRDYHRVVQSPWSGTPASSRCNGTRRSSQARISKPATTTRVCRRRRP